MTLKTVIFSVLLGITISFTAASSSVVFNYVIDESEINKSAPEQFLWNGPNNGEVSESSRNWNRPLFELWGVSDRYPATQGMPIPNVLPYSQTDGNFRGPNGEEFGVEVEFGDVTKLPRQPGSKNVRFYTDFGQTDAGSIGMSRAEVHIRSTLQKLEVEEGSTLWLGWSEKYTHLDKEKITTVFQFRNQPNHTILAEKGFDQNTISEIESQGHTSGGPAIGIITTPIDGQLHYKASVRHGSTLNWQVSENDTFTFPTAIERDIWYDFVVQIKYSQQNNGFFKIWISESNQSSQITSPTWHYVGSTMYQYPAHYEFNIPSPEIRTGVYRHDRMHVSEPISDQDRYMIKYLGPLRMWKGLDDTGFMKVYPK